MTEPELKDKIVSAIIPIIEPSDELIIIETMGEKPSARKVAEQLADALIAAGLKFDVNYSFTAAFNSVQAERERDLECRLTAAEHRAEVAEKVADKALLMVGDVVFTENAIDCSFCPVKDNCYAKCTNDCVNSWKTFLNEQAERELAEEGKDD